MRQENALLMHPSMTETVSERSKNQPGLRHALWIFTAPRSLFARVEDTGHYGPALAVLLGLVMLIGYAQIQTGLIDRVVDQQTEARLSELEEAEGELVDRIQLRERMEGIRKEGEFNKTVTRLGAILFSPAYLLASYLLIASVLYAVVALTGRKPEFHTLMSICVYSGFLELAGYALRLAMMVYYRTHEVDTSLGMLAAPGQPTPLTAIDPFRIWFWVLVAIGVTVTQQLSRKSAILSCGLLAAAAIGARVAMAYAQPL